MLLEKSEIQSLLKSEKIVYAEVSRETGLSEKTVRNVRDTGNCNPLTRKILSEWLRKNKNKVV